jgi:hypothetical protein
VKIATFAKPENVSGNHQTSTQKQPSDKSQLITFFNRRKNPHHFQAHCKRAKRQQHFCKELESSIFNFVCATRKKMRKKKLGQQHGKLTISELRIKRILVMSLKLIGNHQSKE